MASLTTNYAEIQQDEVEALRSIYMEDFEEQEVKTGAWNVGLNMFKRVSEAHNLPCACSPQPPASCQEEVFLNSYGPDCPVSVMFELFYHDQNIVRLSFNTLRD